MASLKTYFQQELTEAGCDEAGRGCYAGPVFAAAVILPENFYHPLLNDSKQVKEKQRNELRKVIEENAIAFGVGMVSHTEIDQINILKSSFKAMHLAIDQLKIKPQFINKKFFPSSVNCHPSTVFLFFLIHQIRFNKSIQFSIHHRLNISNFIIRAMIFNHFIRMKNIRTYL